mgnify:CR=1 FL=1
MPDTNELRRYLNRSQEWELYNRTDHDYYRCKNSDGTYRRIKVSFGNKEIGYRLWQHILKHEIKITQEEFNAGI